MTIKTRALLISDIIDGKPISGWQWIVTLLCGLVMFLDGFDTQSISYMAPLIAREWGMSRDMLGPIFSSALVGLMIGYLLLAPLSDRYGDRRMVVVSTITFGLFTALNSFATNVTELMVLRFVTGLALGAAVPSTVSLVSEYNPLRLRATAVLMVYCGFSLGFVAAGGVAAWLMPLYGWRSLFWVGAVVPLILVVFLYSSLPESIDFMVRKKIHPDCVWNTLRTLGAKLEGDVNSFEFLTEAREERSNLGSLFGQGRGLGTILLWAAFFLNLAEFYALQSWLPTILTGLHYSLNTVALATSLTTVGGIVIAVVMGPAMDRIGPYSSLAALYFLGVIFVASISLAINRPEWVLLTATFFAGVCISGGQKSVIALAAVYYPASIRSTGVGWALGIGRIGGIGGPLLLGYLINMQVQTESLFYAASIPMLIGGILIAIMGAAQGKRRGSPLSAP